MSIGDLTAEGFSVSSDVGGTFTDTVVVDAAGVLHRYKAASTPGNIVGGVLATCELAGREQGMELAEFLGRVKLFSQGTTVATNGLLQRRGATVGLLHTAGFGDTLFVSRVWKAFGLEDASLRDYRHLVKPRPLVERRLTRELPERVDYRGSVLRKLDEDATRVAIGELLAEGAEAFVVSLLWSFKHPEHERRVKELMLEQAPDAFVTASSDLLPRINEYERTVTATVNAFLGPEVAGATEGMRGDLQRSGLPSSP
jgi:N-methylhydantoinase A